jgi:hypothetical protein
MTSRNRLLPRPWSLLFAVAATCGEPPPREQTLEDLLALQREINTTDLSVNLGASPSQVRAGGQLLYAISVGNRQNPATRVRAVVTLPGSVSYLLGDEGCVATGHRLDCDLGSLPALSQSPWALLVGVPAGAAGQTLTCEVTVRHYYVPGPGRDEVEGPDPNLQNNTARVSQIVQ